MRETGSPPEVINSAKDFVVIEGVKFSLLLLLILPAAPEPAVPNCVPAYIDYLKLFTDLPRTDPTEMLPEGTKEENCMYRLVTLLRFC